MKKGIVVLIGLFCSCALSVPVTTHAYFTTKQTSHRLNENSAVFTIEYKFGLKDNDLYMPVLANRASQEALDMTRVTYSVIADDELFATGTTAAIVVSKAPIVDEMYQLKKGFAHTMTLVVLLVIPKELDESDYAVLIDSLPFYEDEGKKPFARRTLNPSELQYYKTPEVELNTGIQVQKK